MEKKNLNELRADLAKVKGRVDELLNKDELTDEEVAEVEYKQLEQKELLDKISKEEARERVQALKVASAAAGSNEVREISENDEKDISKFKFTKFIKEASGSGLSGVEAEMNQEAQNEAQKFGKSIADNEVAIPTVALKNIEMDSTKAMSVGSAPDGGNTVQSVTYGWIDSLRDKIVLTDMGAVFLSDLTSDIEFDRQSSEVTFSWKAENDDADETGIQSDKVTMKPKRLTGEVVLGYQLINQSSHDIEMKVRNSILYGQGRAFDMAGLVGTGTGNEPLGILNQTGIGSVTTGALSWGKVVDMETAVANDNALEGSTGYIFNTAVKGSLKTTEKAANTARYLMENNELNGYKTGVTNFSPANTLTFGNFRSLMLGQWGGLQMIVNPYTLSKKAQLSIVMHFWGDVAIEHPESFSAFTIS